MPIERIAKRSELAFPEIGVIRKGKKTNDPKRPMMDLDYFRVEFHEGETEKEKLFFDRYGETPKIINILLPFENCWQYWLEAYTAGRMVARSDGEKFIYLVDTKTGAVIVQDGKPEKEYTEIAGYYIDNKGQEQPVKCKPTGRLTVVVPELGALACLTVHTTSIHDINNITKYLEAIRFINGKVSGIPLMLKRVPKQVSVPIKGEKRRMTKYLIDIEVSPMWVQRNIINELLKDYEEAPLLPDGEEDDDYEDGEFEDNTGEITGAKKNRLWSGEIVKAIIADKLAKNPKNAVEMLNLSNVLEVNMDIDNIIRWAKIYRDARDQGNEPTSAAKTADDFLYAD